MNQHASEEEMDKRVKKVALENEISDCSSGILALKRYRAKLRQQLEALRGNQKPRRNPYATLKKNVNKHAEILNGLTHPKKHTNNKQKQH